MYESGRIFILEIVWPCPIQPAWLVIEALRHVTPSSFPRKELGGALRIGLPSCRLVFIDIFAEILRCRSVFWSYVKSFF